MPVIVFHYWDKKHKQKIRNAYNTDAAEFICNVPGGKLYKKPRKFNFYIYDPRGKTNREKIREVPYPEAKELVKTHGTREQYCDLFTILNADGSYKKGNYTVAIDRIHKVKLERTASMLSLSNKDCLHYLIDKYDDMRHYNTTFMSHKNKTTGRVSPADISEFTS